MQTRLYVNRLVEKVRSISRLRFRLGTSEGRGKPLTGKPTKKKTFKVTQGSRNNYDFTLTDTQSRGRQINTSTEEHSSVPETNGAGIEPNHTHSSVSDNKSDNAAMTETKKTLPKTTLPKTENDEIRLLSATLNLNKNHRML